MDADRFASLLGERRGVPERDTLVARRPSAHARALLERHKRAVERGQLDDALAMLNREPARPRPPLLERLAGCVCRRLADEAAGAWYPSAAELLSRTGARSDTPPELVGCERVVHLLACHWAVCRDDSVPVRCGQQLNAYDTEPVPLGGWLGAEASGARRCAGCEPYAAQVPACAEPAGEQVVPSDYGERLRRTTAESLARELSACADAACARIRALGVYRPLLEVAVTDIALAEGARLIETRLHWAHEVAIQSSAMPPGEALGPRDAVRVLGELAVAAAPLLDRPAWRRLVGAALPEAPDRAPAERLSDIAQLAWQQRMRDFDARLWELLRLHGAELPAFL